jgi:hypothetical protein
LLIEAILNFKPRLLITVARMDSKPNGEMDVRVRIERPLRLLELTDSQDQSNQTKIADLEQRYIRLLESRILQLEQRGQAEKAKVRDL